MADWKVELPGTVAEGDTGHIADHNTIVKAIKEARTNVDGIPAGKQGEPGKQGDPGKDGFGTKAQYDKIIDRLDALEADDGDDEA